MIFAKKFVMGFLAYFSNWKSVIFASSSFKSGTK